MSSLAALSARGGQGIQQRPADMHTVQERLRRHQAAWVARRQERANQPPPAPGAPIPGDQQQEGDE